ncbi:MAG: hypothetical protein A2103_00615 [Gammaproteobacteria bacterium GWF2_41_13]|nr:MAG: hypothetical protein A2103_00615 [Gammaproteobacteria bacterium GWF2_41_13]
MIKKIIIVMLIGLVCVARVLSAAQVPVDSGSLDRLVATVNDDVITEQDLLIQMNHLKQQMQQANVVIPSDMILRKQVLDQIINQTLQLQYAAKANVSVSPQEVDEAIIHIAQQNNATVDQLYQSAQAQGFTRQQFKDEITKEITVQKVQEKNVASQINVNRQEIDDFLKNAVNLPTGQDAQYHVLDVLIPLSEAPSPLEIAQVQQAAGELIKQMRSGVDLSKLVSTPVAGNKMIQQNDLGWRKLSDLPTLFASPVQSMKVNDLIGPIQAPNGFHVIKLLGLQNQVIPKKEQVELRILLVPHVADSAQEAALSAKIKMWRDAIADGAPFSKWAKKYSQDEKTKKMGGYLGWVDVNTLDPVIQNGIKGLKSGDVSEPLLTPKGWYLVQLIAREQAVQIDDEKRKEAANALFQQKLSDGIQSFIAELRSHAYIKIF